MKRTIAETGLWLRRSVASISLVLLFGVAWIGFAELGLQRIVPSKGSSLMSVLVANLKRIAPSKDSSPISALVAKRDLRANHRIVDEDLRDAQPPDERFLTPDMRTEADFVGHYVVVPSGIKAKTPVDQSNTGPRPILSNTSSSVGWLPLLHVPAPDVAALDAGDTVEVCGLDSAAADACGAMTVEAVICTHADAPATPAACSAAVRLTDWRRRRMLVLASKGQMPKITVLTHDSGEPRWSTPEPSAQRPQPRKTQ